ncbi:pilin N-terminal domain-containing protein, partial [Lacticaseibacillus sharpeae]|uniref:pilin N-terminal domain-containing protein n=1 Tax=Lacticaseibacillus sharpeae TaxID=1626 RepID=UPI001CDABEF4
MILTKYAVAKDTGLTTQKDLTTEPDSSKDRVQGAVFTLYDVTDQYWKDVAPTLTGKGTAEDTTDADSLTANEHKYDLNTATKIDPETGSAVTEATKTDTAKTDANGQITYKDLPNYNAAGQYKVYLFHEESAPTGYTLSPDFVVSLPVKGADGTVYVYPKDEVTGAYQLKFTKIDANSETKLEGAVFYIKNGDQYAQVNGQYGENNQVVGFDKNPVTVKWVNTEAEATQFKSKADGSFGFSATTQTIKDGVTYGLTTGTEDKPQQYTIEEKTAPNGYKID